MDEYHVFVSSNELALIQRDIISDFLEVEGSLQIDIDILAAKVSLVVNLMMITRHENLTDLEYIYKRLKTSNQREVSPKITNIRKDIN